MEAKGASRKDIRFLGRWVGFQKSDVTMLKQPLYWVKIGDGWVGRSKNGQKIGYPLWMAPNAFKNFGMIFLKLNFNNCFM